MENMSETLVATTVQELPRESNEVLVSFQGYLVNHARHALTESFVARNEEAAATVADVTSILAGNALRWSGAAVSSEDLRVVFYCAAREAGQSFTPAFDPSGNKLADREREYRLAMKALLPTAHRYLPAAFERAGLNVGDVQAFFSGLTFTDAIALAARQLGVAQSLGDVQMRPFLTEEAVKARLQQSFASDSFARNVDTLRFGDLQSVDADKLQAMDVAVRLANATWMVGEVHKAAWEGKTTRIDPDERPEFNPYNLFLRTEYGAAYQHAVQSGATPQEATVQGTLGVAFHIWKDVQPSSERVRPEDRLVPVDYPTSARMAAHVKARTERASGYPERAPVAAGTTWEDLGENSMYEAMAPDYTADVVLANDRTADPSNTKLWADPADPRQAKGAPNFPSYEGTIRLDEQGRPLNPMGPTGLRGRGLLGNWGANNAADPMVTRENGGKLELLVIKRGDTGEWALPGGMVDRGERITATLKRELGEETSADLDFEHAQPVYQGYVDDPRNTDNAWMETDAYHLHLPHGAELDLEAGDDAKAVRWMVVDSDNIAHLYASHGDLVRRMVSQWQEQTGQVVAKSGKIGVAA